jgi:hypothetical protein
MQPAALHSGALKKSGLGAEVDAHDVVGLCTLQSS